MREQEVKDKQENKKFYYVKQKGNINTYQVKYGLPEFYKFYKEHYKYTQFSTKFSKNKELLVDGATYRKIVKEMFAMIAYKIMHKGEQFVFPAGLGTVGIRKKKMNFAAYVHFRTLKLDYKASREAQTKVYHTNEHSNGYRYRWVWKRRHILSAVRFYKFIPSGVNKRKVVQLIKNRICDYPEELTIKKYKNAYPKTNIQ